MGGDHRESSRANPRDFGPGVRPGRTSHFGQLPSDRIEFTLGRDLVLEPAQEGEPLNYWINPYAELNGEPLKSIPWTLHFRRLPTYTARS